MKEKTFKRRVLSGILALSMVPTLIPMNSITAFAKTVYSTGEFTYVEDRENGSEFRIGNNTLEKGDLLKAGTVYRETSRLHELMADGRTLNDGDTLEKDMYIDDLDTDHGMLILYAAPSGYETWPETVHEGCDHSSADHFYASGNTYTVYTQEMLEGVLFFTAWGSLNKAILAGRTTLGGQPMPSDFETGTINPGWYYKDEDGVYKRCKSAAPTNKYTLTIPSTAAASDSGFNAFEEALFITGANMADNKEIVITAEGSEFTSETVASRIKYEVAVDDGNGGVKSIAENGLIVSAADANEGYSKRVGLIVDEASFDNADDGEYTTTIKWTAKVRTAAATN